MYTKYRGAEESASLQYVTYVQERAKREKYRIRTI